MNLEIPQKDLGDIGEKQITISRKLMLYHGTIIRVMYSIIRVMYSMNCAFEIHSFQCTYSMRQKQSSGGVL